MSVLEIKSLSKQYGALKVVDGLNLAVEKGSVFGFLGVNGAGKTTTIRMITGLAKPTSGEIDVCGDPVRFGSSAANRHIGYLPDVPEFYGFMKPAEYLTLCGRLCGMKSYSIRQKAEELLQLVGLEGVNRSIGGFSRGMKQRLGIAQALLNDPELLILDEPTSALDPVGRKEILDIIASLRGKLTVLFSTHILSDVERVCDTIGVLHKGSLILQGGLSELEEKYGGHGFRIETEDQGRLPELQKRLSELPCVREVRKGNPAGLIVVCRDSKRLSESVCPLFAQMGLPLTHFERLESNLEDVFMEAIRK